MRWQMLTCWTGSGEKPLKDALKLMNSEGVTSLAVVDQQYNVVGNISNVDVKVVLPHLLERQAANSWTSPNTSKAPHQIQFRASA